MAVVYPLQVYRKFKEIAGHLPSAVLTAAPTIQYPEAVTRKLVYRGRRVIVGELLSCSDIPRRIHILYGDGPHLVGTVGIAGMVHI